MTSMGLSILYLPTFLISHFVAIVLGYEANGYCLPYYVGLQFNLLIYLFLGLIFLRKVLLKYFDELITTSTILALFFGTNLFDFSSYDTAFPHAYEFSLIAIFMYYTLRWYENPKIKYAIFLGILGGLITLIRPSNIVVILFLMLWRVAGINELRDRLLLFIKKWYLVFVMVFFYILIWSPQFIYWKYVSGHYLFFSYGSDAHFDFSSPHIIKGLFSYHNGWLVYTPIMIFSILGTIVAYIRHKEWFLSVFIFLIFNIYIVLSWHCWWYGGSFGLRAFIDSYSILALPLAAFIAWFMNERPFIKYCLISIFCLLILFNLFQTAQYRNGAIHYSDMTKRSYWETFGKLRPTEDFYKYLKDPSKEEK